MKRLAFAIVAIVLLIGSCIFALNGCTAAQQQAAANDLNGAAAKVNTAAAYTSATQPAVQVVETVAPVATPYITIGNMALTGLGLLLSGLAGGFATASSSKSGTIQTQQSTIATQSDMITAHQSTIQTLASNLSDHQSAINALANDVATYKDPGVSFPAKIEKIIYDAAGIVAAAPVQPAITATATNANATNAAVPATLGTGADDKNAGQPLAASVGKTA